MKYFYIIFAFASLLTSCEKVILNEEEKETNKQKDNVTLTLRVINDNNSTNFNNKIKDTRALVPIKDVCKTITLAIFEKGEKKKTINQQSNDENFGTFSLSLPKGEYQYLIVAHNSKSSPSISSLSSVSFSNKDMGDTFYSLNNISLTEPVNREIVLKRAVAMFRLVILDEIPAEVTKIEYSISGGSLRFNPYEGKGITASKQKETIYLTADMHKVNQHFDFYTFPRNNSNSINVMIKALGNNETIIQEKTFTNVSVYINAITEYSGKFFENRINNTNNNINIKVDNEWLTISRHSY